jgi:hypothetical protein
MFRRQPRPSWRDRLEENELRFPTPWEEFRSARQWVQAAGQPCRLCVFMSLVTGWRVGFGVGTGAQRAEISGFVWQADHGIRAGVLFSIEWSRSGDIETAGFRVGGVSEPETHVEGMSRGQAHGWIETENLIEQDGIDGHRRFSLVVRFDVGLVPSQAKIHKVRVDVAIGQQICVLNGEKIEAQLRLEVLSRKSERVAQRAALDRHAGGRSWSSLDTQTAYELRLSGEVEGDLLYDRLLVLSEGRGGGC